MSRVLSQHSSRQAGGGWGGGRILWLLRVSLSPLPTLPRGGQRQRSPRALCTYCVPALLYRCCSLPPVHPPSAGLGGLRSGTEFHLPHGPTLQLPASHILQGAGHSRTREAVLQWNRLHSSAGEGLSSPRSSASSILGIDSPEPGAVTRISEAGNIGKYSVESRGIVSQAGAAADLCRGDFSKGGTSSGNASGVRKVLSWDIRFV